MDNIKYGHDAIDYAESAGLTLSSYTSPIEGARDGLSVDDAREIAREDPSLIWIAPRSVDIQAACELLFEAGRTARHEGGDADHADALFDSLIAHCDPEYAEAATLLEDEYGARGAVQEFALGLADLATAGPEPLANFLRG